MSKQAEKSLSRRNVAERVSLSAALVVLSALVGAIGVMWWTDDDAPAEFTIAPGAVRRSGEHYYLPFRLANGGQRAAREVKVEGVLAAGQREVSDTQFDYVFGDCEVEGCLIFTRDPSEADLRVVSYQEPD